MTPKEKAKDLVDKFENTAYSTISDIDGWEAIDLAKQCALISVDDIIQAIELFGYSGAFYDHPETGKMELIDNKSPAIYWNQVKTEIEKL